jgi:hypothetical protein
LGTLANTAIWSNVEALGACASIIRLQARASGSIELQPVLGILLIPIIEGEFSVIK